LLLPRLIAVMDRWRMAEASELTLRPVCMEVEADVTIAGIGLDAKAVPRG
jgi:hypothetical protein